MWMKIILDALTKNDIDTMMSTFTKCENGPQIRGVNNKTLIHCCAVYKSVIPRTIKFLIASGINIDEKDYFGRTALVLFVKFSNNLSLIKSLLDSGADPNIVDDDGKSALYYSASFEVQDECCYQLVRLLLMYNAYVNIGESPNRGSPQDVLLEFVRMKRCLKTIVMLVEAGANLGLKYHANPGLSSARDYTILHFCHSYESNLDGKSVIKYLIDVKGADVNKAASDGVTPLLCFIRNRCDTQMAALLLARGADPLQRDIDGNTALHYCKTYNLVQFRSMVKLLLKKDVDINATNRAGHTTLTTLIIGCHELSMIEFLLEEGANPNKTSMITVFFLILMGTLRFEPEKQQKLDQFISKVTEMLFMYGANIFATNQLLCRLCSYLNEGWLFYETLHVTFKYSLLLNETIWNKFKNLLLRHDGNKYKDLESKIALDSSELAQLVAYRIKDNVSLATYCLENNKLKLGSYFRGSKLSKKCNVDLLKLSFPCYSELIEFKVRVGKKWFELQRKLNSVRFVSKPSSVERSPVLLGFYCMREIFSYLDESDVVNTLVAAET